MRSALVPSNIAHDEALEVRDAVPTTLVRWDWAYRTEFPKRCRDPLPSSPNGETLGSCGSTPGTCTRSGDRRAEVSVLTPLVLQVIVTNWIRIGRSL